MLDWTETMRALTLAQEVELERLLAIPLKGPLAARTDTLARGLETWRWVDEQGETLAQADPEQLRTCLAAVRLDPGGTPEQMARRLRTLALECRDRQPTVRDLQILRLLEEPWQLSFDGMSTC